MLNLGDRVEVSTGADYTPYTVVSKGERGTVVWRDDDGHFDVCLDRVHPGLNEKGNAIWISPGDGIGVRRVERTGRLLRYVPRVAGIAFLCFVLGAFVVESAEVAIDPQASLVNVVSEYFGDGE